MNDRPADGDARIVAELLKSEGWPRYTNSSADKGGPTRGGITLTTLREWRRATVTVADLKALTQDEAEAIYRERYIVRPRFNEIRDELLRCGDEVAARSGACRC
jgi:lysozyme family protein